MRMQDARSPPGSVKLPGSWNRVKALDLQGVFGLGNPPYNQGNEVPGESRDY
jgi:hypothetical protein